MAGDLQRAVGLAREGRQREARRVIARILKQNPEDVRIWAAVAQVVGDRQMTIDCLKQAFPLVRSLDGFRRARPGTQGAGRIDSPRNQSGKEDNDVSE